MPHELYKTADGKILPSVTEILGVLGSPTLMRWANTMGFRRVRYDSFMDERAMRGTVVHNIAVHLVDATIPVDEYELSPDNFIAIAHIEKQLTNWMKTVKIKPTLIEKPILSEELGYAGCPDLFGEISFKNPPPGFNGKKVFKNAVIDWKTASRPHTKHFLQIGGYANLIQTLGYTPKWMIVINLLQDRPPIVTIKNEVKLQEYSLAFGLLAKYYQEYQKLE